MAETKAQIQAKLDAAMDDQSYATDRITGITHDIGMLQQAYDAADAAASDLSAATGSKFTDLVLVDGSNRGWHADREKGFWEDVTSAAATAKTNVDDLIEDIKYALDARKSLLDSANSYLKEVNGRVASLNTDLTNAKE